MIEVDDEHAQLVRALKEALITDPETSPLLIKRIPFICQDIREIKTNMGWHRWLLLGIAGGIGLLALKSLGI